MKDNALIVFEGYQNEQPKMTTTCEVEVGRGLVADVLRLESTLIHTDEVTGDQTFSHRLIMQHGVIEIGSHQRSTIFNPHSNNVVKLLHDALGQFLDVNDGKDN